MAKQHLGDLAVYVYPPSMSTIGIRQLDTADDIVVWSTPTMLPPNTAALVHDVGKEAFLGPSGKLKDGNFFGETHVIGVEGSSTSTPPTAAHQGADLQY